MPSPFPGIDPYIEARGRWGDFHTRFLTYLCDEISDRLPETYVAQMEEQVRLARPGEGPGPLVRPDVGLFLGEGPARGNRPGHASALMEPVSVELETNYFEEPPELWIEIRRLPDLELVALVELLSPSNKAGWDRGDFLARRSELLKRTIHLVELDFLLEGQRLPMRGTMPLGDAFAIVSRSEDRPKADVYAWTLRDPLPSIAIPLAAPDPDLILPLAAPYATAYERSRYGLILHYERPLDLKVSAEDRAWAEAVARREPA